jgi:hypothetical protein
MITATKSITHQKKQDIVQNHLLLSVDEEHRGQDQYPSLTQAENKVMYLLRGWVHNARVQQYEGEKE